MRSPFRRPPAFQFGEVLPESVRTALSNNGARLGRSHIESSLLSDDRFKNLGFYLLMKATDNHDGIQTGLLDMMAELEYNFSQIDRNDESVQTALDYLEDSSQPFVQGGKLAQVSRHGSSNWLNNFDRVLRPRMEGDDPPELFMLANSAYIGLDRIAALTVARGSLLRILKPSRFKSPDQPVGFTLSPADSSVEATPLEHGFKRPEHALVFDDVTNLGSVKNQVMEFWGEEHPEFTAAIVTNTNI